MTTTPPGTGVFGRIIAGRYELTDERGRGPRAVIHTAFDRALERRVMVKLFLADAIDATRLQVQEKEVRRVAGLEHPALTRLFDAGIETGRDGRPFIYLVTEYNDGKDLRDAVVDTPLSETSVAHLGQGLAEALAVLHDAGLVHANIAPSNILVQPGAGPTRAYGTLTEIEIGYLVDERSGARASMTDDERLPYQSPQIRAGDECTAPCDVFGLGATLTLALTGAPPQYTAAGRLRLPLSTSRALARTLRAMTAPEASDRPTATEAAILLGEFAFSAVAAPRSAESAPSAEEKARATERDLAVLTREPRDFFDRLTRLATRLTGAPISFLSIVYDGVLSPRGMTGLASDPDALPYPSLCAITVDRKTAWTVADIGDHPHTREAFLPLTAELVRSYAGAPLLAHDGTAVGSLCVYSPERREFTASDLAALSELAAIAVRDLELSATGRRSSPALR